MLRLAGATAKPGGGHGQKAGAEKITTGHVEERYCEKTRGHPKWRTTSKTPWLADFMHKNLWQTTLLPSFHCCFPLASLPEPLSVFSQYFGSSFAAAVFAPCPGLRFLSHRARRQRVLTSAEIWHAMCTAPSETLRGHAQQGARNSTQSHPRRGGQEPPATGPGTTGKSSWV